MAITNTFGVIETACPANTDEAALYLVPAATEISAVLRVVILEAVEHTFKVAHCKATGAAAADEWLAYDVPWNGLKPAFEISIHAKAGEEIRIESDEADKITFHLSGQTKVTS